MPVAAPGPSSSHWKLVPPSVDVKETATVVAFVRDATGVIVVCGAIESITQL